MLQWSRNTLLPHKIQLPRLKFVVQTFSNPVLIKLDEDNYLPWKQQAEAKIEGFDLVKFITSEDIPCKYASTTD